MTTYGLDKATEPSPRDFDRILLRTLTSLKKGDFSVRMPVEFTGTQGKIADTLNDIAEQNERMCAEIARISNVVGKEGKLNSRMTQPAANGAWAETAEAVNSGRRRAEDVLADLGFDEIVAWHFVAGDLGDRQVVEVA